MKKKSLLLDIDDVLKNKQCKNILHLLELFENHFDPSIKGKIKTKGLRSFHFRFALMNDPGLNKPIHEKAKKFFNDSITTFNLGFPQGLEYLYKDKILMKGSIENPQMLSYYLKKLVIMNFIDHVDNKKPFWYRLTKKYWTQKRKKEIKDRLKIWDYSDLSDSWKSNLSVSDEMYLDLCDVTKGTLFGISSDMLKDNSDKKLLFDCLKNIYDNLFKIMEFKFNKIYPNIQNLSIEEFNKMILTKSDSDNWISFYFDYPIPIVDKRCYIWLG